MAVGGQDRRILRATPAVRHRHHARGRRGRIFGGVQIAGRSAVRLDQENVTVRTGRGHRVQIEADFDRPAVVGARQRAARSRLVDLLEAATGRRARRQPVRPAERGQVSGGGRIVVGVDNRDPPAPGMKTGQLVRRPDLGRREPDRGRLELRAGELAMGDCDPETAQLPPTFTRAAAFIRAFTCARLRCS